MLYQVPPNKVLLIDTIIAATDTNGINLIGIFIDDEIDLFFPINSELFYSFNEKIKIKGKLEIKYKPSKVKSKLSLFIHGILI